MEILILSLWGVGLLLSLVGGIWLLILAFRQSVLWGLAVFFIPFASLFFIVKFWAEARHPFFVSLVSVVLLVIGISLGAMTSPPLGAMGVSGTEVAGFEASSDPFGSGDPFGSRQPSQAEDPSTARPSAAGPSAGTDAGETGGGDADRGDQDIDSLLAEIDGRDLVGGESGGSDSVEGGDFAAEAAGTERPEEPRADTGGSVPVATSTATDTRRDRREVEARTARRRSSVPRSAGFPRGSDRSISRDQLSRHVGRRLEVDMADGDRLQGVLEAVEEDQIRLRVSLGGGFMTLRLSFERIEDIRRPR